MFVVYHNNQFPSRSMLIQMFRVINMPLYPVDCNSASICPISEMRMLLLFHSLILSSMPKLLPHDKPKRREPQPVIFLDRSSPVQHLTLKTPLTNKQPPDALETTVIILFRPTIYAIFEFSLYFSETYCKGWTTPRKLTPGLGSFMRRFYILSCRHDNLSRDCISHKMHFSHAQLTFFYLPPTELN